MVSVLPLSACNEPDRYGDVRRDPDAPAGETYTGNYLADPPATGEGESLGRSSAGTGATDQGLNDLPASASGEQDRQRPSVRQSEE